MHPILVTRQRLGLYLLAWLPLAVLLALLLVVAAGSSWPEAVGLALPLLLVYAFLCLTAWYPCRALPLASAGAARAVAVHGVTGIVSSLVWVALAWAVAAAAERSGLAPGAAGRIAAQASWLLAFGVLAYLVSVSAHYLMAAFEASREAERRAHGAELTARDAELAMLRSQVDPHFMFNSLNSIASLITTDPGAARRMCVELGELLRGSLRVARQQTRPFAEELAMARRFLAIEQLRLGDRLAVEETIGDGCERLRVPAMLLQPLLENALKHGIADRIEGGTVELRAWRSGSLLELEVCNPVDPDPPRRRGPGVGLDNLRRRLRALYGNGARLLTRQEEGVYRAMVVLPVAEGEEEVSDDG